MNIFFLGAGFSRPVGLPLGDSLFGEIMEIAKIKGLYDKTLKREIDRYIKYFHAKTGKLITESQVNLEDFMSYIDIEYHLALRGKYPTKTQEIIKNLIAYVLYAHEAKITSEQFSFYENFCKRFGKYDIVYTFNYDTILEKALKRIGKPYRLYPARFKHDERWDDLVLDLKEEVAIFKVHGSINWFDKSGYDTEKEYNKEFPHVIFDGRMKNRIRMLLDYPFPAGHSFKNLYVIDDLDDYFSQIDFSSESPFIISPSYHKLSSLSYLRDFWYGQGNLSNFGSGAKKIVIIGFSLPSHDEYIRQPLYWFIRNFQNPSEPLYEKRPKLKIIDFKRNQDEIDEFKSNYRFVNQEATDFYFKGFSEEALDFIFSED